jgi:ATP-binding cassette subfamily B protein
MDSGRFSNRRKLPIFFSYYRPHWRLFVLDLSCAFGISLIDLSFPLVTRYSIQDLLPHGAYGLFALVVGLCLLAFAFRAGLQYIVTYWGHLLGVRMETDMRRDLFAHLQKLSFSFYDKTRTGHLMSRVLSDLFEIVELAHHGPEDLFIATVTLVGSFIAMLFIRWQLALVLVVMVPAIVLLTIRQRKIMSDASLEVKQRTAIINAGIESSISGIRVSKAFANEDYEIDKFLKGNDLYRDAKKIFYKAMGVFQCGMEFATSALNVVVLGLGGLFIVRGMMDLADLIAFTLFVNAFLQPIRKLVSFFEQYTTGMAGFERFVELMRVSPEIVDRRGARELPRVKGDIELRGVSFSYAKEVPVLKDVDLRIEAGRTLALVGPSGGGKSTLCQLIPRFYELDSGSILVDGIDIRDITLDSLRENIGIVQQDVFLFADTIKENIRYGRVDAGDEDIVKAAKRADIHEFIESLPEGYDTEVGERGVLLSGGQKQRISIARIFLKNPPILILDEATSALDTTTELHIQAALEELSRGRTSLIIAHRLSTIRDADEIVFVDDEGIVEKGSHAELMAARGRYAALYGAQFNLAETDFTDETTNGIA